MAERDYDPSLEFPGFENPEEPEQASQIKRQPFSLVLLKSAVLSTKRRVVDITQHLEVSIGRDRPTGSSSSPRLRLKEMAVSKYHAILYWDAQRDMWGLVDVGSVHGTFVQAEGGASRRLSPPKVASHPHFLRHLDVITIGGTHLQCHMHPSKEGACSQCEPNASNLIPLTYPDAIAQKESAPEGHVHPSSDPKASMASLKKQLLARHDHSPRGSPGPSVYVDRAALRREHLGVSQPPVLPPPTTILQPTTTRRSNPYARLSNAPTPERAEPPTPPPAISESNIGHRLLAKQGWQPGTGLGVDQTGRAEPVILKSSDKRAGLGMPSSEV